MWRKGNSCALLVGLKIGAATKEKNREVPQKMNNRTILWHSNSTLGCLSEETQKTNLKRYTHTYVHCTIIYSNQNKEQPKCPSVDNWRKWCINTMDMYLAFKKSEILICDNMDGPRWYYTKWSKSEIERRITIWFHLYVGS